MTLELEIETVGVPEGLLPFLESVAEACLAEEGISGAFAAMRIVDEQTIRSVNAAQRGVDAVTDVLSFPSCRFRQGTARDNPKRLRREYDPSVGKAFLGDILLCLKRAGEQAEEYGHPVLSIDRPYNARSSGQLRTRMQAFVESLEIKRIQKRKQGGERTC